jgi:chemotaxis response regulator CheB
MPFVFVTHRASRNGGFLEGRLAGVTRIPVRQIHEGMIPEPNMIFVTPARMHLTTDNSAFHLLARPDLPGWLRSISAFLSSVATILGSPAIAAILPALGMTEAMLWERLKPLAARQLQLDAHFESMPAVRF